MKRALMVIGMIMSTWSGTLLASDKPIEELPRDVMDLAFVWTKPIQQVAEESRRFDPVSGLWFGLLEGSVKSVERTAQILLFHEGEPSSPAKEPGKIFRYSF